MKRFRLLAAFILCTEFANADPHETRSYHRIESKGIPAVCLSIPEAGSGQGEKVLTWLNSYSDYQHWELRPTRKGCFRIVSRTCGKFLTAAIEDEVPGPGVYLAPESSNGDQLWRLRFDAEGFARIVSKRTGLAITAYGGRGQVVQVEKGKTNRQKWKISQVEIAAAKAHPRMSIEQKKGR